MSTSALLGNWKKNEEYESDDYTNCIWCSLSSDRRIITGTGGLGKKRTVGDHPNDSIIENGQNIEKSIGDLSDTTCKNGALETIPRGLVRGLEDLNIISRGDYFEGD